MIPTTLRDSLLARLDRLGSVRIVAQIGAAIGRQFPYPLLRAVSRLDRDRGSLVRGASGWNPPRGSRSNALTHHCQSVGRGYHTREVETFDAPLIDQNANREMFEESVEVMFKAFEGKPFSHQGKYYTIPPEVPYRGYTLKEITLVPAPERLPVECWR